MKASAKITWTAAALVVAGLAVGAGSAVATVASIFPHPTVEPPAAESAAQSTSEPTPAPTPTPTPTVEPTAESTPNPGPTPNASGCPTAQINLPGSSYNTRPVEVPELAGELKDTGPRAYAKGEPTLNDAGQIVSYTAQPGDSVEAIAWRFCMGTFGVEVYNHTHGWDMQPGDVIVLRPSPDVPWSPRR